MKRARERKLRAHTYTQTRGCKCGSCNMHYRHCPYIPLPLSSLLFLSTTTLYTRREREHTTFFLHFLPKVKLVKRRARTCAFCFHSPASFTYSFSSFSPLDVAAAAAAVVLLSLCFYAFFVPFLPPTPVRSIKVARAVRGFPLSSSRV